MSNPLLKIIEPDIDQDSPWGDDKLERQGVADKLTALIKGEVNCLTISLNGGWGSGKTYLLKRWRAQLQKGGCRVIYFNAWEDDFLGDPLVAIIGQLWVSLKDTDLNEIGTTIKEVAKPLFYKTVFNATRVATGGVIDLSEGGLKSVAGQAVEEYFDQQAKKDDLKKRLSEMAAKVTQATGYPLVFIVDELDRCRPTFSIELLERVKHIFDIPNMVFVFGVDRTQLASSIKAVYGQIDVDGYLRRFFDMDFAMPSGDTKKFCQHLMKVHGMSSYFKGRSEKAKNDIHQIDYNEFADYFPKLCAQMGLSLRDMEQCFRAFIFVAKNIPDEHLMFPLQLTVLLVLRLKNPSLYLAFSKGVKGSSDVLDYLESFFPDKVDYRKDNFMDVLEMDFYLAEYDEFQEANSIRDQLATLADGKEVAPPYYLSARTRKANPEKAKDLINWYDTKLKSVRWRTGRKDAAEKRIVHQYLIPLIELTLMMNQDVWK